MSTDIVITDSTTIEQLHQEVYVDNRFEFSKIYAELIVEYPQYESLIKETWTKSSIYEMSFSDFQKFILDDLGESTMFSGEFDY